MKIGLIYSMDNYHKLRLSRCKVQYFLPSSLDSSDNPCTVFPKLVYNYCHCQLPKSFISLFHWHLTIIDPMSWPVSYQTYKKLH